MVRIIKVIDQACMQVNYSSKLRIIIFMKIENVIFGLTFLLKECGITSISCSHNQTHTHIWKREKILLQDQCKRGHDNKGKNMTVHDKYIVTHSLVQCSFG